MYTALGQFTGLMKRRQFIGNDAIGHTREEAHGADMPFIAGMVFPPVAHRRAEVIVAITFQQPFHPGAMDLQHGCEVNQFPEVQRLGQVKMGLLTIEILRCQIFRLNHPCDHVFKAGEDTAIAGAIIEDLSKASLIATAQGLFFGQRLHVHAEFLSTPLSRKSPEWIARW